MRLFLIAGEPSGDKLGAALMAGLKALSPHVTFSGIGGPLMQAEGLRSLFPMEELSVMGLMEVLPKYRDLKRRIAMAAGQVTLEDPAALITIDSPDFCLRVARLARAANPKLTTIHYVAPSVWAWRPGRAKKMARFIDHVMALLPFEPPYMEAAGMSCDFVGHPVVAEPRATPEAAIDFRLRHGIAQAPLLLALPGSRGGEVSRLTPIFGETVAQLARQVPGLRVALPTVVPVERQVRALTARWPVEPLILIEAAEKRAAFAAADVALAASGTVSLELAANRVPMVIAYDMNRITLALMKRMARIDTVTLVNLVSDTREVPEYIGPECQPALIAKTLARLFTDPRARAGQVAAMDTTMLRLGLGAEDPGLRAARSVLQAVQAKKRRLADR